jgi:NitT/TauT family transport system substrate-binding protein
MKKKLPELLFLALLAANVAAAGNKEPNKAGVVPKSLKIGALVGPSGIGMSYLFANPPKIGNETICSFETFSSVDMLLPKLLNGDIDIGILPPNIAAKLYNIDSRSIVAGAIVGNGMITLITRDASIHTLSDLAGKTVSVIGQGSTPEYVIRALLAKEGIDPASINLDFSLPAAEIAPALIGNKIGYAFVPEPFATVAMVNGAAGEKPVRRAIHIGARWKADGFGDDFPMTLCVVRKKYADAYPETIRAFLAEYRSSIEWTVQNPSEAGKIVEAAELGLKAQITAKAIPHSNYIFITAHEGRKSIESLLSIFLNFESDSIGGKLPSDGFYFK